MRAHLPNAAYGVLDYAAYPIAMLLAAPLLLKHLGIAQYGVWVVATAVVTTGGIIAAGFGDANIQHVAGIRTNADALLRAVRSMMGINLVLGTAIALLCWTLMPAIARHVVPSDPGLQLACLRSLRIASLLTLVRAIESVCISTQRAFERYGAAVRISILARLLTLVAAIALALRGRGITSIMVATAILMVVGTLAQLARLQQHLGAASLLPSFDRSATAALFAFGAFSWLQAVSGVIFSQADRLILGVNLGATAVTTYALCVQMAQPIHGLTAAGLHFLFPHLSLRFASSDISGMRRSVFSALALNLLTALILTAGLILFGPRLLALWMGPAFASQSSAMLSLLAVGYGLLALNVTAHYSLLAMGRVRLITALNVAGGIAMLLAMAALVHSRGVQGAALARLCYGPITCLLYLPLFRLLRKAPAASIGLTQVATEEA